MHYVLYCVYIALNLPICIYHTSFIVLYLWHWVYRIAFIPLHLSHYIYHMLISYFIYHIAIFESHLSHCIYSRTFITIPFITLQLSFIIYCNIFSPMYSLHCIYGIAWNAMHDRYKLWILEAKPIKWFSFYSISFYSMLYTTHLMVEPK